MARKADLKQVDDVWRRHGPKGRKDLEFEFREYIHEMKEHGDRGSNDGDFTYQELVELLKAFLGEQQP